MKRIFLIICLMWATVASANLFAQTPEEVVERMTAELSKGDSLGMSFDFVMSIPIIGEFRSTNYTLGDKMRMEMSDNGKKTITWSDGVTDWEYDAEKNEVKITNAKPKENNENTGNVGLAKAPPKVMIFPSKKRQMIKCGTSSARKTSRTRIKTTQRRCTLPFPRPTIRPFT